MYMILNIKKISLFLHPKRTLGVIMVNPNKY